MSADLSGLLYLVASICFIMALRGLSSPDTARAGNLYGIIGMAIAILTTLASPYVVSYWLIAVGLVIGGAVGAYIARQIQMTALPQLAEPAASDDSIATMWDLGDLYATPQAWSDSFSRTKAAAGKLDSYRGTLAGGSSEEDLKQLSEEAKKHAQKVRDAARQEQFLEVVSAPGRGASRSPLQMGRRGWRARHRVHRSGPSVRAS